jgi:hypothetical protein
MAHFKQNFSVVGVVLFALLLNACGKKEENVQPASGPATPPQAAPVATPAPQSSAPPASSSAPAPAGNVLASDQSGDDPDLRGDLLQVKRVSGGALMIKFRVVNTSTQPKDIYYNAEWGDFYFTDPAENKKYSVLRDSENNPIGDSVGSHIHSGEQRVGWAKFPAPPASSTKISVHIPRFAPFEDVPVAP